MSGFRYKLYRFMQGRRGLDNLGRFLIVTAMVLMLVSMFLIKLPTLYRITYYVGLFSFVYAYFRAFSKNLYKREMENNKFLALKYKVTKGKTLKQWRYERKVYTFFKCPGCGQKMRAPKGKGTIKVKCHQCGSEFNKNI